MLQDHLVSVVVPVYERTNYIRGCIASILTNEYRDFEVLVIDQSKTDAVKSIIAAHFGNDERTKYIHTHMVGVSHARNLGIKLANGYLILFTDDDVIVSKHWISAYVNCYDGLVKDGKRPGVLGGPMSGIWEDSRPAWWPDEFAGLFCDYNIGTGVQAFPNRNLPFGGNYCMPRPCLDDIGDFSEHLGLVGTRTSRGLRANIGGGDSELALRAARRGYELYYVPEAGVQHRMSREQSTEEYFLRRLCDEGATLMAVSSSLEPLRFNEKLRMISWALIEFCWSACNLVVARLRRLQRTNPKRYMYLLGRMERSKGSLSWLVGQISPHLGSATRGKG